MKIIGIILTWNNFEFFKCVLTQALSFCDEVIVAEGCHLKKFPIHSTDGTYEYIQFIKDPKLVIIDINKFNRKINNKILQCQIRQTSLQQSKYWDDGNWIIQWDDDTLFFEKDLSVIKQIMKTTDADILKFRERRFAFNFRFNLLSDISNFQAAIFQKIKPKCSFIPPSKICNPNKLPYDNILKVPEIIYHHYPYVKLTARVKFRWEISCGNENTGALWDNFLWENDQDIFKQENLFRKIIGGSQMANLNVYNGPHPEILNSHPWKNLNDVRSL